MADTKRITPEEVVEAYRKTGLMVSRRCYFDRTNLPGVCACGLGAYAVASLDVDPLDYWAVDHVIDRLAAAGFKKAYSEGFRDGFDDVPDFWRTSMDYVVGYKDGKAAYKAAKKEAANA